jgi:protein-disulfide isomerase
MGQAASYPRSVKRASRSARRSPRVYYSSIWATLVAQALLAALVAPQALAQVEITWSPSMVKGPSGAPVTIVEFSDYQ